MSRKISRKLAVKYSCMKVLCEKKKATAAAAAGDLVKNIIGVIL